MQLLIVLRAAEDVCPPRFLHGDEIGISSCFGVVTQPDAEHVAARFQIRRCRHKVEDERICIHCEIVGKAVIQFALDGIHPEVFVRRAVNHAVAFRPDGRGRFVIHGKAEDHADRRKDHQHRKQKRRRLP